MFGVRTALINRCRALSRSHDRLIGRIFDLRYGISTTTLGPIASDTPSRFNDNITCVPSTYQALCDIFRVLSVRPEDVFVDFGCGLGRTVCFAAQYPFAKVYGVEISGSLASCARSNVERLRSRAARSIEIEQNCRCQSNDESYISSANSARSE